jgi:hypothetical protein
LHERVAGVKIAGHARTLAGVDRRDVGRRDLHISALEHGYRPGGTMVGQRRRVLRSLRHGRRRAAPSSGPAALCGRRRAAALAVGRARAPAPRLLRRNQVRPAHPARSAAGGGSARALEKPSPDPPRLDRPPHKQHDAAPRPPDGRRAALSTIACCAMRLAGWPASVSAATAAAYNRACVPAGSPA